MSWETLDNKEVIAMSAATIALFVAMFGVLQFYLTKRKERFDSTMWLFERLQDPEATRARFRVTELRRKARKAQKARLARGEPAKPGKFDFAALTSSERAELASIGGLMGLAGLLFRQGRIDRRLFLDAWASSVRRNFNRLQPYMTWRDDRLGPNNSLWREFERFAKVCAMAEKQTKDRKLSLLEWLTLRAD